MASIAAIIVGIDGWEQYTLPLVKSVRKHEPKCQIAVVDNASKEPYRITGCSNSITFYPAPRRLCYSAAINYGRHLLDQDEDAERPDWYIVLSNDVLCTAPFAHMLEPQGDVVAGPQLWREHGLAWIVGWCVACPRRVWGAVGGWDENYVMSSVEDVDFSVSANEKGYPLCPMPNLPFVHLDQRQRFGLPGYAGSEEQNWDYFRRKHGEHAY